MNFALRRRIQVYVALFKLTASGGVVESVSIRQAHTAA